MDDWMYIFAKRKSGVPRCFADSYLPRSFFYAPHYARSGPRAPFVVISFDEDFKQVTNADLSEGGGVCRQDLSKLPFLLPHVVCVSHIDGKGSRESF